MDFVYNFFGVNEGYVTFLFIHICAFRGLSFHLSVLLAFYLIVLKYKTCVNEVIICITNPSWDHLKFRNLYPWVHTQVTSRSFQRTGCWLQNIAFNFIDLPGRLSHHDSFKRLKFHLIELSPVRIESKSNLAVSMSFQLKSILSHWWKENC